METQREHVKYVVEIKQIIRVTTSEMKQFCTSETPTEIQEESYANRKATAYDRKYDLREVPKVEIAERSVYRQEVEQIELVKVINAVNGV